MLASHQLTGTFGFDRTSVWRAVQSGVLVQDAPGAFRIASHVPSFRTRCVAASMFARGVGFVSGDSAARVYGLRKMNLNGIRYTVPTSFRRTPPDWLALHYSAWYSPEHDRLVTPDNLIVAQPMRMLFGLPMRFTQFRFDRAADDAWNLGLIDPPMAADYLERHRCRGKDGVARLERWIVRASVQRAPSQSYFERDLIAAVEAVGLPEPERQYPLQLRDGRTIHLDVAWPSIRLAVEPGHSWFHPKDQDRARDLACDEVGWHIIRVDESMRGDLAATARSIARIHAHRRRDLPEP